MEICLASLFTIDFVLQMFMTKYKLRPAPMFFIASRQFASSPPISHPNIKEGFVLLHCRIRYLYTWGVVDILTIFPVVFVFTGNAGFSLIFLRILRMLRMVRIFRHYISISSNRTLEEERELTFLFAHLSRVHVMSASQKFCKMFCVAGFKYKKNMRVWWKN